MRYPQSSLANLVVAGVLAGSATAAIGQQIHGFLDVGGTFTTIDAPGSSLTQATGINDAGQIVGIFDDRTGTHGFLKAGSTFTTMDVPGFTTASGINNAGQIVGQFRDIYGVYHGFLEVGGG